MVNLRNLTPHQLSELPLCMPSSLRTVSLRLVNPEPRNSVERLACTSGRGTDSNKHFPFGDRQLVYQVFVRVRKKAYFGIVIAYDVTKIHVPTNILLNLVCIKDDNQRVDGWRGRM